MKIVSQIEKIINRNSSDKTQNRAMHIALYFTVVLWFILFILFAISPGSYQKKKYKTVQITLAPVPVEVKKPQEKKVNVAKSAEKKIVSEKKEAKTEVKTVPKKEGSTVKKTETVQKKANIKYKKSVDDLMEGQTSSSKSKSFDWDSMDFEENTNATSKTSTEVKRSSAKTLNNSESLKGSAGVVSEKSGAVTSETSKNSSVQKVSGETRAALGDIEQTTYSLIAAEGLTTELDGIAKHSNGKFSLEMEDGSARILVYPKEPRLLISKENAKLIDSTKHVKITLKINKDGTVPLAGISFSPISVLPGSVRSELASQLQTWRFSTSDTDGQATFDYTITKG